MESVGPNGAPMIYKSSVTQGATYQLSANQGSTQGQLLFITEALEQRIIGLLEAYYAKFEAEGHPDPKAAAYSKISSDDISSTHNVVCEKTYTPCVEFATETIAVPSQTGSVGQNGGTLTYSLPVYGDFIHDMAFFTLWSSMQCAAGTLPDLPDDVDVVLGEAPPPVTSQPFVHHTFTPKAKTINSVHYYYLDTYTKQVLNPDTYIQDPNNPQVKTSRKFGVSQYTDYCRYVNHPGEFLAEQIKFSINGNPIDQYNKYSHVFH